MRIWYHPVIAAAAAGLVTMLVATGAAAERPVTDVDNVVENVEELFDERGHDVETFSRSRELDDELRQLHTKLDDLLERIEQLEGPPPGDREFRRPLGDVDDELEAADTALDNHDIETARTRLRDARRILEGVAGDLEVFERADEKLPELRADFEAHRADTRLKRRDWMPDNDWLRYQFNETEAALERLDEQLRARESTRELEETQEGAQTAMQDLDRAVEATDRPYGLAVLVVVAALALLLSLLKLTGRLAEMARGVIGVVRGRRQYAQTLEAQDRIDRWNQHHDKVSSETRAVRDELDDLIASYGLQPVQAAFERDELEALGTAFAIREAARETGDRLEKLLDSGDAEAIDEYLEQPVEIGAGEFDGTTVLETRPDEVEEIERERLVSRLEQLTAQLQPIVEEVASRLEDRAGEVNTRDQHRDRDPESIW